MTDQAMAASHPGTDRGEDDWRPVRKVRAYEQVLRQIEERIRAGQLRPGDHLPGERELSAKLEVSRPSLREALRVLEALGIIVPRPGKGGESGTMITTEPGEALTSMLRFQIALSRFSVEEVVETRTILERGAGRQAAAQASAEHLAEMARILKRMEDPSLSPRQFNELDTDFHLAVARAGKNQMVAYWMHALREVIREEMTAVFEQLPDWRASTEQLLKEHQAIYDAIREGDVDRVPVLIENHIISFYRMGFAS